MYDHIGCQQHFSRALLISINWDQIYPASGFLFSPPNTSYVTRAGLSELEWRLSVAVSLWSLWYCILMVASLPGNVFSDNSAHYIIMIISPSHTCILVSLATRVDHLSILSCLERIKSKDGRWKGRGNIEIADNYKSDFSLWFYYIVYCLIL